MIGTARTSTRDIARAAIRAELAAAALSCLNIALDHWTASDGRPDLTALLDEAFAALAG